MKNTIKKIPILNTVAKIVYLKFKQVVFNGSAAYWEERYSTGGNSGSGSYAMFAEFKADIINKFVGTNNVDTVIEFGCGDGNQLSLATYGNYMGFDVSNTAIEKCKEKFKSDESKSFTLMSDYNFEKADLVLSLDVLYHLVEDSVYERYMTTLFKAANKYVIIYSSDIDVNKDKAVHVRHRKFTEFVKNRFNNWKLMQQIPNKYPFNGSDQTGSFANFYIYEKSSN